MADMREFEEVELHGMLAWHAAASRLGSHEFDWSIRALGGACCSVSTSEPSILVNRVMGLGLERAPTHDHLVGIRTLYADAGVGRFFLHVVPDLLGPDREQLLTDAGYVKYRGWMKFSRSADAAGTGNTGLSMRRIDAAHAADFAAIACNAFDIGAPFRSATAALVDASGWQVYMSFDGDRPAGTGALFRHGRTASVDFGATHPDFRRRGSQKGLLNARIRDAAADGCTTIVTMTGEAVPGDAQQSYRNILKAGFAEHYLRENWIPAGT
jgi:GNAT superfamily N-acetyltransferase